MNEYQRIHEYMDQHPGETVIDYWTLHMGDKGVNRIHIYNPIRDDVRILDPKLSDLNFESLSIMDTLTQVMFLDKGNILEETKPAKNHYSCRVGPIDVGLIFKEANPLKHKCRYKKTIFIDGTMTNPVTQEIIVQRGDKPIYHHLIWTNDDLAGSYVHIDAMTNEGQLVRKNGKLTIDAFQLVSKFSWNHFGQTRFYHFDGAAGSEYWPIILTSEGLLYETQDYKFKRICEKKDGKIEILNVFV